MGFNEKHDDNGNKIRGRPDPYVGPERRHGMRVDLTVNIPTMISIFTLVMAVSASGVGLYNSIDKRQIATEYAVSNLITRVEKAELALSGIKADQTNSNSALRQEMRADLAEIKGQLERILFSQPPQRQYR